MLMGVDYQPSFKTIAFLIQETGEYDERRLNHSCGQAERFYRDLQPTGIRARVGLEATGYLATGVGTSSAACARTAAAAPDLLVARAAAGQDGLNSFSVLLADARSDFQRAKSREFSVTSVASVRIASDAISRSRKWLAKSIRPKVLRERRSRMPVSIQAEPGGEEKWPKARWARQSSSRARFSCWRWVPA